MPVGAQEAIVCHEMAHIRRGDWAFTIVEEFVRSLFWFHPCVWWLLGQVQLTREEAVDREVIDITASRDNTSTHCLPLPEAVLNSTWPRRHYSCKRAICHSEWL